MLVTLSTLLLLLSARSHALVRPHHSLARPSSSSLDTASDRRTFFATTAAVLLAGATTTTPPAQAIGPVKLELQPTGYTAAPCPPNKPIPGEKAMQGMRGLCVTVQANLMEAPPKELEKVGVYGFITDGETGDSVLANNPDLSTDAGQFAMIETVSPKDKKITFEFIAAVPEEKDLSSFKNGIGPLKFESLRIISFPGGQQYGAISPCEMNEFSDECAAWEEENGPYKAGDFMVRKK